jgi:iron complex outermembrane recepter protein
MRRPGARWRPSREVHQAALARAHTIRPITDVLAESLPDAAPKTSPNQLDGVLMHSRALVSALWARLTRQLSMAPACAAGVVPGRLRAAEPMRSVPVGALLAGMLIVHAAATAAQDQTLDAVVVLATRQDVATLDLPASVDVVEGAVLRDARLRVNLSESLGRVPGLVILNRQNYAQDLQVSVRGFGSRASFGVRGVRLYVDGVPASFPDGQGQVSHFPLAQAERVEVLRGPFSALYGNASGGVLSLTTRLPREAPRLVVSGAAGADGTWRAGLSAAGGNPRGAVALEASRFETDGARPHSAARRDLLNLRTALDDTPLGRLRLSLNALAMPDAQDPLGLTRTQLDADPGQAAPAALQFNTRKTTRQASAGADLQTSLPQLRARAVLSTTAWLGERSVTQFQAIPVAVQLNPSHPGGVIDFDRRFGGADLRLSLGEAAWSLSLGLTAEGMQEDRRGFDNFGANPLAPVLGTTGQLRRDERNRVRSVDPYAQLQWTPAERWVVHAGLRASTLRFESADRFVRPGNGDDSGNLSYRAANPSLGLVWRAAPQWSLYAAYGRGFETPTLNELAYRSDGTAGLNSALREARSDHFEAGAKWARGPWRSTLAAFAVRTEDDIVVRSNFGGRAASAPRCRRRREGLEAALAWQPAGPLSALASATWIDARFGRAFLACGPAPCATPTLPVPAGNALPAVPRAVGYAELRYRAGAADLALEWRAQSGLWVDDRNTDRSAAYGLLAVSLAADLAGARVFARVDNLLDRGHVGSVIVNEGNGRFFEPGPRRTWLVGLDWPL